MPTNHGQINRLRFTRYNIDRFSLFAQIYSFLFPFVCIRIYALWRLYIRDPRLYRSSLPICLVLIATKIIGCIAQAPILFTYSLSSVPPQHMKNMYQEQLKFLFNASIATNRWTIRARKGSLEDLFNEISRRSEEKWCSLRLVRRVVKNDVDHDTNERRPTKQTLAK